MSRLFRATYWLATLALAAFLGGADARAGKSEDKIKVAAVASDIGADGKQVVIVTLEIEKGYAAYAVPRHKASDTYIHTFSVDVAVKGKEKLVTKVNYPAGKIYTIKIGRDQFQYEYYEGRVEIEAHVQRTAGDKSPLEVTVQFRGTDHKVWCPGPATIKLTVTPMKKEGTK